MFKSIDLNAQRLDDEATAHAIFVIDSFVAVSDLSDRADAIAYDALFGYDLGASIPLAEEVLAEADRKVANLISDRSLFEAACDRVVQARIGVTAKAEALRAVLAIA